MNANRPEPYAIGRIIWHFNRSIVAVSLEEVAGELEAVDLAGLKALAGPL